MSSTTRTVLALAVAVLLAVAVWALPVRTWLEAVVVFAEGAGPAGAVAFTGIYVLATVAALPVSVLTLGAGLVYGPFYGFAVVWPGAVLGSIVSFVLGRTLLRDTVEARLEAWPRFAALDDAMGEGGFTLVALMRLSPVFPFNLLNYGLGLTGVSLPAYAGATALGIIPGTFLYIYLGSTLSTLGAAFDGSVDGSPAQSALYWGGLLATLVVTVLVTAKARAALDVRLDSSETP